MIKLVSLKQRKSDLIQAPVAAMGLFAQAATQSTIDAHEQEEREDLGFH